MRLRFRQAMFLCSCLLLCGSGCATLWPEHDAIRVAKSLPDTTPWDLTALSRPPQFEWSSRQEPVWSLYYSGLQYKGKPTRVFAYYATPVSRIGLKPATDDRVKTSQCPWSFRTRSALALQGNLRQPSHPVAGGRRAGSLGSAAVREWALRQLVGAWPPQAERAGPVEHGPRYDPVFLSCSSLSCSLGLSASWAALSFRR